MKTFFKLFIFAAALQLSWANPIPSPKTLNVPAYYHKRYELFDSILLKINEVTSDELLRMTSVYPAILKDYQEWLKDYQENNENDLDLYQDLKAKLEKFPTAVQNFKQNRLSCELQREMQTQAFDIENVRTKLNNKAIHQIWDQHHKVIEKYDEEKAKTEFVNVYFKELTKKIEEFLQSLDDTGKNENVELIKWCDKFLTTTDVDEKLDVFNEIEDLYEEELEREKKAGNLNCRLIAQIEFMEKIVATIFMKLFAFLMQMNA